MESSIGLAPATSRKAKDDFINQAHEARQARLLTRHKEKSATIIQAFLKSVHTRQKLKKEVCEQLEYIIQQSAFSNENDTLQFLRKLLFVCDSSKDRNKLNSLLLLILTTSNSQDYLRSATNVTDTNQTLKADAIRESIELSSDHIELEESPPSSSAQIIENENFIRLLAKGSLKSNKNQEVWLNVMEKIINLCFDYLGDTKSTRLDLQHIDTYLHIVNLFTSSTLLNKINLRADESSKEEQLITADYTEALNKFSANLISKTLLNRKNYFSSITTLISERISRFRNDLKASILFNYIQIAVRLLYLNDLNQLTDEQLIQPKNEKSQDILIIMLSIPGLTYYLEKFSPKSLKFLNDSSIFNITIRLLVQHQDFQELTSSSSVCLLANVVHLASMNEDVLIQETMTFVALVSKLLESCQKNMLLISSAIVSNNTQHQMLNSANNKKKNESRDVSFNPLLGWLTREQSISIDKEVAKSQLSHLWSIKFIKIFLMDLIKANEKLATLNSTVVGGAQTSYPGSRHKSNIFSYKTNSHNQTSSEVSSQLSPVSLFKRVVERAATTMNKTINSSYVKNTGASSNSGSAKLLTAQANRISLVCYMLHTTLRTLSELKQDILTGLCLHDYILPHLWTFISSLGAHNGLRAFLDHLTIYTKTSAPEFYILILFCDCASHLISILDDSELYEKQRPFLVEDLVSISSFLNNFVFRIIWNNLIPIDDAQEMDPILKSTHKLLTDLYRRDCRRKFASQDHWLIKDIKISLFLKDLEASKPVARTIMKMLPHIIPQKERVLIFRKLVLKDKSQYCTGPSTLITIHRSRIVEDGYQQLARLPPHALKGLIRVKFINDYGLDEAGIDQDGVFKEFLEDTIKRVFDPALNLFCSTSEQRLYPSPTSRLHEDYLSLFNFVGKMLGKAVYEGIVVDVPFASFFLSRVLGQTQSHLYSPIDELPSLDPELYKSLTYIKHYEGDVSELDLTFSIDQDFMGKIETYELEAGGKSMPVTRESRVRYIHSVANFRMKTQIEKQTDAFVNGFKSIINVDWLTMFSASELQRLISGDNTPIDLHDLRRHTKYFGGFHNNHRVVCWLWDILEKDFSPEDHRLFLKFVTSCSKPPLLGFANLEPPFSIRCVEVSDDQDLGDTVGSVLRGFLAIRQRDPVDRLPTSSTCFNLLKLPNYQRRSTLREKLRYAIRSNPGFELS